MNIFQNQLVMNDGRTLREQAVDGLPEDCPFVQSLDPQAQPAKVSVEEFLRAVKTDEAGRG